MRRLPLFFQLLFLTSFAFLPKNLNAAKSSKPTNTKVIETFPNSLLVSWKEKNNGNVLYSIICSTNSELDPFFSSTTLRDTDSGINKTTSTLLGGLLSNNKYWISVQAQREGKDPSDFSSPASSFTLALNPSGLQAVALAYNKIQLSWISDNPPNTAFEITYSTDNFINHNVIFKSFRTNYALNQATITSLSADTLYFFRVRAQNQADVATAYSQIASARTLLALAPEKPTLTRVVSITSDSASITWKEKNTGLLIFTLGASIDKDNLLSSIVSSTIFTDSDCEENKIATATISGLIPNTQYWFWVSARRANSLMSEASSADSAVTLANPPNDLEAIPKGRASYKLRPDKPSKIKSENQSLTLTVSEETFSSEATVFISSDPINAPVKAEPERVKKAIEKLKSKHVLKKTLHELSVVIDNKFVEEKFKKTIRLEISYAADDQDADGWLDGLNPAVSVQALGIWRLNEDTNAFESCPNSTLDTANFRVYCDIGSFSVYAVMADIEPAQSASEVYAYPVPWRLYETNPVKGGANGITFKNLPSEGEIQIYNITGELVHTLKLVGANQTVWDGKTRSSENVASGLYIWRLTSQSGSKTGKLLIIR